MTRHRQMLIGFVAVLVLAALAAWWVVSRQPLFTSTDGRLASSSPATTSALSNAAPTGNSTKTGITKMNRSAQTVQRVIANLRNASRFRALLRETGVIKTISSDGRYTIFVPTNAAFGQLPGETIANLTAPQKKRLVEYHIVSGRAVDVSAQVAGNVQALSGDMLNFNYGANKIPLVNSAIVIAEYMAKNGTVYLIDNVLLPPKKAPGM